MKRIFMVGYMGAGKTTAGKELAKCFDYSFYDLDHFIETRFNKTIVEIFEQYGEDKFREIEREMLMELGLLEDVIISTGGGTPCHFDNMDFMLQNGIVVYLEASPSSLLQRLNKNKHKRPLIKDKDEEEMLRFISDNLEKRNRFYNKSTLIYNTDSFVTKGEMIVNLHNIAEQIKKTIHTK